MLRKIADSTVSLVVLAASRAGFLLLVSNLFGALALGVVGVATSTMMLFGIVMGAGAATVAIRSTARDPSLAPRLRADAVASGFVALPLAALAIVPLLYWFGDSVFEAFDPAARAALPLLVATQVAVLLLNGTHQGGARFALLSWSHVLHLAVLALATLGVFLLGRGVGWLLLAYVVAQLAKIVFLALRITAYPQPYPLADRLRSLAGQTRAGAHMMVGWLANLLNYRVDLLLLAFFVPTSEVGLYAAAAALSEVTLYLPRGIAQAAFPWASAAGARLEWPKIRRVLWLQGGTAIAIGGLLALAAPLLLSRLFGAGFEVAAPAARVLLLAAVFGGLGLLAMSLLYGLDHARLNTRASGVSVLVNVVANLILIPKLGILGAAYGSCASYLVYFVATTLALRRVTARAPQAASGPLTP